MSELGPDARRLLGAARFDAQPDELALARVRARVAAAVVATTIGGTAAASSIAPAAPAAAAPTAMLAAGTAKWIAAVVVAATIAGGAAAVIAVRTPSRSAAPPPAKPVERLRSAPRSPPARVVVPPVVTAPIAAREPELVETASPPVPSVAAQRTTPRPISLAREVELVDLASAANASGDYSTARAQVARYVKESAGHGQLAEEASAIDVEAACRGDEPDAAARLAAFAQRWPRSRQLDRLVALCPGA